MSDEIEHIQPKGESLVKHCPICGVEFDASETTTVSAATPVVVSDVNLASDAIITVDIDQVDGGGVAAGLKISLIGSLA